MWLMIFSCCRCELVENDAIRGQKQSKISVYIQLCWADQNCWRAGEKNVIFSLLMSSVSCVLLGVTSYSSSTINGKSWYDLAFFSFSICLMKSVCSVIHSLFPSMWNYGMWRLKPRVFPSLHVFPWTSETQVLPVQRKERKCSNKVPGFITSPFLTWPEESVWRGIELFRISVDEWQKYVHVKSEWKTHEIRSGQGQWGYKMSCYKCIGRRPPGCWSSTRGCKATNDRWHEERTSDRWLFCFCLH